MTGDISEDVRAQFNNGGLTLEGVAISGLVQDNVGDAVYADGDDPRTLTLSPTSNVQEVGFVERFISAGVGDVKLYSEQEYRAKQDIT